MSVLKQIQTLSNTQVDYSPREVQLNNKQYLVVPVVMMVEGVHHGSGGPILHLAENFSRTASAWNGIPLTAGHPHNGQTYISVNEADPDRWVVGHVANARVQDNKLKADAYIDIQKSLVVNAEIINYIKEEKKLEVSTGALTTDSQASGQFNNEQYEAVTLNYLPDHLALLPGSRGACSWNDGCGIRNNENKQSEDILNDETKQLKDERRRGLHVTNNMQTNAIGFQQTARMLQDKLDSMDTSMSTYYLEEVYDDHYVYKVYFRNGNGSQSQYYRQEYHIENDMIQTESEPTQVRRNVEYLPMQNNENCGCSSMKRTKTNNRQNNSNMSQEDNRPSADVMEKVVALVNNQNTHFSKSDKNWLLNLNEDQLDKLVPKEVAQQVNRQDALQTLSDDLADPEKLKQILPEPVKNQFEVGLTAYNDKKQSLIKTIQTNTGDTWPTETLENMDMDTLSRIEKSSRKTDYSGQGGAPVQTNHNNNEPELMLPVGVELDNTK